MFGGKRMDSESKLDINMTPLIDVSLVLVVMLLLATPLAFESSIAVRQSKATARQAEKRSELERVEITLVSEDSVRLNGALVARASLTEALQALFEDSEQRFVVVDCKHGVSHGAFVDVLDQAKVVGARDIAIIGR
jgi:biopolymer transport protein TolR